MEDINTIGNEKTHYIKDLQVLCSGNSALQKLDYNRSY
jgi:hypothetical protein